MATNNIGTITQITGAVVDVRFDADLPLTVKKFWFIASMCDPRFKKLTFEGDNMLKPAARREAVRWFSEEYNNKYKGSFAAAASPSPPTGKEADGTSPVEVGTAAAPVSGEHVKRRKVSSASFFAPRVAGAAQEAAASPASHTRAEDAPHADELAALVTKEHGKSLADSAGDVFRGYEVVEHACSFGSLNQGETT